jgi:hypothetical protein
VDADAPLAFGADGGPPPVVGPPTPPVKNPAPVAAPPPEPAAHVEGSSVASAVHAAEAVGHKRALNEAAQGQIHVPDLGRVEVSARLDATRVDVHVRAAEDHARDIIAANAPEMRAHLRVEVPNATVHVERSLSSGGGGNADSGGRDASASHESRDPSGQRGGREAERTRADGAEPLPGVRTRGRARFVL